MHMLRRRLRIALPLLMLPLLMLVAPPGARADDPPRDPALSVTQANGVTREVIGSGLPAGAAGQELVLLRFTFEPGAVIPPHIHPGMQTAYVLSGTLGYTVLCGYALVTMPPVDGSAPVTEQATPGPELLLPAGASFTEVEGLVHFGRNAGSGPLVLLVSSLLGNDQSASIPVDSQTAPQCASTYVHA